MSQEVMEDPLLWSFLRITGIRDITAFAIGAIIGDITRFATPKKLVNYLGYAVHPPSETVGDSGKC